MVLPDTLRSRLERMAASDHPDARSAGKAMLSLLALVDADPHMTVRAHQIAAILSRHLLYHLEE